MRKRDRQDAERDQHSNPSASASQRKAPWVEPKLTFVEPKLTKQGDLKEVTAGFFGTFVP